MGGKSVYLRMAATIAVLAHIGCYVPAAAAEVSVLDALLSRMGAADDISTGRCASRAAGMGGGVQQGLGWHAAFCRPTTPMDDCSNAAAPPAGAPAGPRLPRRWPTRVRCSTARRRAASSSWTSWDGGRLPWTVSLSRPPRWTAWLAHASASRCSGVFLWQDGKRAGCGCLLCTVEL